MLSDSDLSNAFSDIARAARTMRVPWALIGGQALRAYGVPRNTLDADALVPIESMVDLAEMLVASFEWTPLSYDDDTHDYVEVDEVTVHYMDDPVLFDVGQRREMIPLHTPFDVLVEFLAAQHPVEEEMIVSSKPIGRHGVIIPVAPLGGVLLVKVKADRSKDIAAIEQTAEHLPTAQINEAVAWAESQDPATADDLRAILGAAKARRVPVAKKTHKRKR